MEEPFIRKAQIYAAEHQLRLSNRLGFGIHGTVLLAENNSKTGKTAVKVHRAHEPYYRECRVYERLREADVSEILGFNVPQLIRFDDGLHVVEMTVVARPFLLDFAGAYLDTVPDFSEVIWAEWEVDKREQFGERWTTVQAVLVALKSLGIHMVDVSPSNLAFS